VVPSITVHACINTHEFLWIWSGDWGCNVFTDYYANSASTGYHNYWLNPGEYRSHIYGDVLPPAGWGCYPDCHLETWIGDRTVQ
jgi:hypothetical protein